MGVRLAGIALVLTVPFTRAQTNTPSRPEFEVASIKPSTTNCCTTAGFGNGGVSDRNVTLKMLMAGAYRLQEFQISGGPRWVGSDHFDVEAKAADHSTDPDQLRLMLQSLLADRFKLEVHREMKA